MTPSLLSKFISLLQITALLASSTLALSDPGRSGPLPPGRYFGPDKYTEEGQRYLQVFQNIANFPGIGFSVSQPVYNHRTDSIEPGNPKFRHAFGPIFMRGKMGKNQIKVLVIGQDGTHIAEGAGAPFVGGTGGRMENVMEHLGVKGAAAFINTFTYTINGQYADFAPVLVGPKGKQKLEWKQILTPEGFLMSQDLSSPIVQWRNQLIDAIIENNKDSLRLVVCVGGAARDTLATYIRSKGKSVPTLLDSKNAEPVQTVKYASVPAGGNREFFYPVDGSGNSLLFTEEQKAQWKDEGKFEDKAFQGKLQEKANSPKVLKQLVKSAAGPEKNGILDRAQLGSDLYQFKSESGKTCSLEGLRTSYGSALSDVRFITVQHPGSMSAALESNFIKNLGRLPEIYAKEGWSMDAEPGQTSRYQTEKFKWGRGDVDLTQIAFGKSEALATSTSTASRASRNIIEFGSRQRAKFAAGSPEEKAQKQALAAVPETLPLKEGDVAWEPSRTDADVFDPGPTREWEELITAIDAEKGAVFQEKEGKIFSKPTAKGEKIMDGVDALSVRSGKLHGFFGHYRGKFETPEVLVLADPVGAADDAYSGRALTGEAGQRLQGFMDGLGVGENYLVLKTIPVDMEGASETDWEISLERTRKWRESLVKTAVEKGKPKIILAFGQHAETELERMRGSFGNSAVISANSGFASAYDEIKKIEGFSSRETTLVTKMHNIPRAHLPFSMQTWVGTGGNRCVRVPGKLAGVNYQIVVPYWVTNTDPRPFGEAELKFVEESNRRLSENGFVDMEPFRKDPRDPKLIARESPRRGGAVESVALDHRAEVAKEAALDDQHPELLRIERALMKKQDAALVKPRKNPCAQLFAATGF